MEFHEQRRRALDLLIEKGIPAAKAEPLPLRLAHKLGIRLRPLYFETFGPAMAVYVRRQHGKLGLPSWEALAA